jgi:DNA-binding PadR family transcriptional regulator
MNERRKALQGQLDEMRRLNRDKQVEWRNAIKTEYDEIRQLPREERELRKKALEDQLIALRRQHQEQQEQRRALEDQLREISRQQAAERSERKTLREQLVEKVEKAREEHIQKHHSSSPEALQFQQMDNELRKGFLKQHILLALSFRPAHGYELMHWVSHHTGHSWTPSPGSMYPALESLESKGFITSMGDGRRRVYSLTPKGDDVIAQLRKKREEQFLEMKAFMSALLDE